MNKLGIAKTAFLGMVVGAFGFFLLAFIWLLLHLPPQLEVGLSYAGFVCVTLAGGWYGLIHNRQWLMVFLLAVGGGIFLPPQYILHGIIYAILYCLLIWGGCYLVWRLRFGD